MELDRALTATRGLNLKNSSIRRPRQDTNQSESSPEIGQPRHEPKTTGPTAATLSVVRVSAQRSSYGSLSTSRAHEETEGFRFFGKGETDWEPLVTERVRPFGSPVSLFLSVDNQQTTSKRSHS